MASVTISGSCDKGSPPTLYGRITSRDGSGTVATTGEGKSLKKSDISSLSYTLKSVSIVPETFIKQDAPLVVSDVIFDTLQKSTDDSGYKGDGKGFNFRYTIPPELLQQGGRVYRFQLKITTTGGTVGYGRWIITTVAVDP